MLFASFLDRLLLFRHISVQITFLVLSIPICNLATLNDAITNGKRSGSYERVDNTKRSFPNKFFICYNMQIYVFHHTYAIGYAMPPSIR
ncbi:hypothetical protein T4B_3660 [Trichinella pseudospiralis]|uniref:Uncharacterized protein n=1 Tax=Trichinella pseudospiralis TaxID=6337 RepID=A0A0V1H0I9_TRIPS|nr:hypothetical protein T4A_322 [Trichinella pseudospiralis]KRZ03929.1 hypothetical protein T4B_3660 [Trichinella pseudospiralis]KRZ42251.1 hypothetical protein T4C_13338 [Trichinella pseudospiralis]